MCAMTDLRNGTRLLGLILIAPCLLTLATVIAIGSVSAQTAPPFPNCTGKKVDPNAECTPASSCPGSDPCSSWTSATATQMCTDGVAGDNCVVDPNAWKNCGNRGTCSTNQNGDCVRNPGSSVIQTNTVADGGNCTIPG